MKTAKLALSFAFLLFMASFSAFAAEEPAEIVVRPVDHGSALRNPGMGWVFHHYDNSIHGYGEPHGQGYDGREFPGLTTVYLRIAWSHLEPKEGEINWSILDSVIQRYARAGNRFAFRLTTFEGVPDQGAPEWLREAGCPGYIAEAYNIKSWEPDYSAPFYLEKLANFLNAVGKRYDGHPDLEFVDVGTLGIWGEGNPIYKKYPLEVLKKHIDLHRNAFPTALLVGQDDWASSFRNPDDPKSRDIPIYQDDPSITQFTFDQGLTLRDDSLNVYADPKLHYSAYRMEKFWPVRPTVLEMGHYDYAKKVGAWGGERYLQAVEDYHGSYTSIHANPIVFLKENKELVDQINRRLGYRLNLIEAAFPAQAKKSDGLTIRAVWKNGGIAPCYGGGHPIWTLLDSEGNIGAVLADETLDVKNLAPAESLEKAKPTVHTRRFLLSPKLHRGKYTLCVSVGDLSGRPKIALPIASKDSSEEKAAKISGLSDSDQLRYELGQIVIE